jgi:putative transcriptional regulator
MHGVVLVCQHTDQGAYGLVVNRPSAHSTHDVFAGADVLGQLDVPELPEFPVFIGGPVGQDTLQVLHSVPKKIPGGIEIANGIYIGGELPAVLRYLLDDVEAAARTVRLTLGYAGWGEGQLEVELATGSWLPAAGDASVVFRSDVTTLWRDVVRSIGGAIGGLADQPPDPQWN